MSLNPESRDRIAHWRRVLRELCYRPLGPVQLHGFTTLSHLHPEEALKEQFYPMPPGTCWGADWEYGWFRGEFVLPPTAAGERIALNLETGCEGLVWVNGAIAGARDRQHSYITLALDAQPGASYDILAESYAGHGFISCGEGPIANGREWLPPTPAEQSTVGESTYGIWDEQVFQLWVDATVLWELREKLDPLSLRVDQIDRALMDMTLLADVEQPRAELLAGVKAARERLQPVLEASNGSTAPLLYGFGHAHIDVAWLWPLQETQRKTARTFSTQLALMEEYPEYIFLQSEAQLYAMLKVDYPDLYARVAERIRSGNVIAEGSAWVEPDTNVPSGESLIRQFVHGKRYFRDEFGVECTLFWEPDVFGYSAALPQIMAGCGIKYFGTQKIMWQYNAGDPFPYNDFVWQGVDGSEVLAHIFHGYGYETSPKHLIDAWQGRAQKSGTQTLMIPFGYGDGGGGVTREHLEYLRRARDLEGSPRTVITSPLTYYEDMERRGRPKERYVGELYFQAHRGTFTSQAQTKRLNRKSELALREAEMWGCAAQLLAGYTVPLAELDAAWKQVLLNQFHDILPGSSIARVYEEAEAGYIETIAAAEKVVGEATAALIADRGETHLTLFNSLSFPRTTVVGLECGECSVTDSQGRLLPVQWDGEHAQVEVTLPACGWSAVRVTPAATPAGAIFVVPVEARAGAAEVAAAADPAPVAAGTVAAQASAAAALAAEADTNKLIVASIAPAAAMVVASVHKYAHGLATETGWVLENELLRATFDASAKLVSLWDKETEREWMAAAGNEFLMYKDVPRMWDAWDIDSNYVEQPVALSAEATVEVVSAGPLVAALRVTRQVNGSQLTQEIRLRRGSRRIDFVTAIEWQEKHKLLKVAFPVAIHADEAISEIQFAHVRRPNHKSRQYDADRFEVPQQRWTALAEEGRGAAVLNDCKYGVDVDGNAIRLTLLKSAMAPDPHADEGRQDVTYSLYVWNGSLYESGVVAEAYDLNSPVTLAGGAPVDAERSLFNVSAPNVFVDTVKPAEDGSGDVVVRLYEAKRTATRCTLSTSLPLSRASQTNMLEDHMADLSMAGGQVTLDFRPFEVKTIRLS